MAAPDAKFTAVARAAWQTSMLASLPERAQLALLDTAAEIDTRAGEVVYQEMHEPTRAMFGLVCGGLMRVFVSSSSGREVTIRLARVGDVVGLPASVAGGAPMGVQALTDGRLLRLQVATMQHLARHDGAVAWAVSIKLTSIIFEVTEALADNVFRPVTERVARALLDVARDEDGALVTRIGQQELADQIGSVREVVARAMGQLRDAGLVRRDGPRTVIPDVPALTRLIEHPSDRSDAARR